MKVERLTPILNVSDIQASFAWFEKLGWMKVGIGVIHPPSAAFVMAKAKSFFARTVRFSRRTSPKTRRRR